MPVKPVAEPSAVKTAVIGGSSRFYRPELDALRFLAFLMVFVHHMLPHDPRMYSHAAQPGLRAIMMAHAASCLGAGLPLFFSLSAYLLTVLLLREKDRTGTVHMGAFYLRRILRIWPLYILVIGLSWLAARLILHDHRSAMFVAYLLMLGNWTRQLGATARTPLEIGHLWSISVEEQFYLVFPWPVRFANRSMLLTFTALLACGSAVTLVQLSSHGASSDEIWRNSFVQCLMFAVGIALGIYTDRYGLPQLPDSLRLVLLVSGMFVFFAAESVSSAVMVTDATLTATRLMAWYLPVAIGCGMLLVGTLGLTRDLPRPLVYLGRISYGLYVFHAWGLNGASALLNRMGMHRSLAAKDLLAFCLTVLVAMISYRFYESPFLRLKERFEFVRTRPV